MKTNETKLATSKRVIKLAIWTATWVITMAVATFGPVFLWNNETFTLIAIIVNVLAGIGMIFMNRIYINGLDEMQRKINLDAMAIALGIGVVGGLAYATLDSTNLIAFDAEIGFMVAIIGISYMVSLVIGNLRYK
jgi:hypothetical protein